LLAVRRIIVVVAVVVMDREKRLEEILG